MIDAGIIGGSGYTGGELARLICNHPEITLKAMTSRKHAGVRVNKIHPSLKGFVDLSFENEIKESADLDLVFVATPYGASMGLIPVLLDSGVKVVDLSGDYRLDDPQLYRQWYGIEHKDHENLGKAVYGIPELFADQIASSDLVANPGCYPTSAILSTAPLFAEGLVNGKLIVDAKSGSSGAGMEPSTFTHHPNCGASISPYQVGSHRHTPEIQMGLQKLCKEKVKVTFTPHLIPVVRGILCTSYCELKEEMEHEELYSIYQKYYGDKKFIRVNSIPSMPSVIGSNFCEIGFEFSGTEDVVLMATLDNLTKGAAGQAIQNANLMFGLDEAAGLDFPGLGV